MILLDMDGVIADFAKAACTLFASPHHVQQTVDIASELGLSDDLFWNTIDREGEQFWSEIPETPWCNDILSLLKDKDFVISTSPPKTGHYAATGKIKWLKHRLGPR